MRDLKASIGLHARRFFDRHAPEIRAAEAREHAERQASEIRRLQYLAVEGASHEVRQMATNELEDLRRARIARLRSEPEPIQQTAQITELQRRHVLGIVGIPSPA